MTDGERIFHDLAPDATAHEVMNIRSADAYRFHPDFDIRWTL
jgi:hypothetical protein